MKEVNWCGNLSERDERKMGDTLADLRALMASHAPPLDALVVPSEDYHQVIDHSDFLCFTCLYIYVYL